MALRWLPDRYRTLGERAIPYIAVYTLVYLSIVAVAILRQLSLTIRVFVLLFVLSGIATFLTITFGIVGKWSSALDWCYYACADLL